MAADEEATKEEGEGDKDKEKTDVSAEGTSKLTLR